MTMGVFVAHTIHWNQPSLSSGDSGYLDQFLGEIRESVDVACRVNARWMTVVLGFVSLNLDMDYQELNVINALKQASEFLEPHNLSVGQEPLNRLLDHPGMVLNKTSQAFRICKHVNNPACKILYDAYLRVLLFRRPVWKWGQTVSHSPTLNSGDATTILSSRSRSV